MRRAVASLFLFSLAWTPAIASAQESPPQDQDQDQPQPPPDQNSGYQPFSPDQLDNLLSPIALYPDPLLAQTLVAATYPDQVEEAARYVRANGQRGIDDQDWDVSVKAIAHYPTVVQMMADKIDWTTSVGQAYVNQSADVSQAVQRLRHLARHLGNLETTPQEEVIENGDYLAIDPAQPQYIYVPVYDPAICFYRRPYWGPAITFGVGYPIGAWLNLDFRWGYGGVWGGVFYTGWRPWGGWNGGWMERSRGYVHVTNVYINNRYRGINVNRTVTTRHVDVTNINRYNYVHRNVTYDNVVRRNNFQTANRNLNARMENNNIRPANNQMLNRNIDANARINDFRGREGLQGRPDLQGQNRPSGQIPNRGEAQNRPQGRAETQNRPSPQNRPVQENRPAPQYRPAEEGGPHTFGRSEGNFSAQASSQRGQVSRQEMSRPAPAPRGGGGGGGHPSGGGGGGRPAGGGGGGGRRP